MARDRRLVVLDGMRSRLRVELDGKALRVVLENSTEMLVPLARVDRIICRGNVTWDSAALVAVATSAAIIAFSRGDGSIAAWLCAAGPVLGFRPTSTRREVPERNSSDVPNFAIVLERVSQRADWQGRLADYCRAELSRSARAVGFAESATAGREGWAILERAFQLELRQAGFGPVLARDARAFLECWTRRRLNEYGFPGRWLGLEPNGPADLGSPFAAMIGWLALPLLCRQLNLARRRGALRGRDAATQSTRFQALMWAELATPRLQRLLHPLCQRFFRHIDELHQDSLWNEARVWDG